MSAGKNTTVKATHFGASPLSYKKYSSKENFIVFPPHMHRHLEFIHIIKGELNLQLENETILLKENDICYIESFKSHSGSTLDNECEYDVIQIKKEFLQTLTEESTDIKRLLNNAIEIDTVFNDSEIKNIFAQTSSIFEKDTPETDLIFLAKTYELLSLILSNHSNNRTFSYIEREISNIIEYLDNNFSKNVSITDLSNLFGYDISYLSRKFKFTTGVSPVNYINIQRLKKAEYLLLNSNFSVETIGQKCGFENTNYFIRRFKKHYNTTPLRYRKLNISK